MSETQPEVNKVVDPLEQWRTIRDSYLDIWAKAMGEAVNSEAYSKASGAMLETFLMATPFREAQKKMMLDALEQMNMPSRADFVSLAERLSNVEILLDDIDTKLSKVLQLAAKSAEQSDSVLASVTSALQAAPAPALPAAEVHPVPENKAKVVSRKSEETPKRGHK